MIFLLQRLYLPQLFLTALQEKRTYRLQRWLSIRVKLLLAASKKIMGEARSEGKIIVLERMQLGEFKKKIESGKYVVDFHASWCGPCKRIAPYFQVSRWRTSIFYYEKLKYTTTKEYVLSILLTTKAIIYNEM